MEIIHDQQVHYMCPDCAVGSVKLSIIYRDNTVVPKLLKFLSVCDICGHRMYLNQRYPYNHYIYDGYGNYIVENYVPPLEDKEPIGLLEYINV